MCLSPGNGSPHQSIIHQEVGRHAHIRLSFWNRNWEWLWWSPSHQKSLCLLGSDMFIFITIPNPSKKVEKEKKNPFFSPKINKNREEERREREVRMELWRRREKKRRRPGARGSEGRNGKESLSAPGCPAEQPPPSAPCCPPGKQLLYWAASSTVQRRVTSQRTRWVLWSILRNGAKSQKGGRRKKRESTILSLFDCKTSLRAQLAPRQSPWKTRRLAFLTVPLGLGSGQQLKAPRHTFREELWEVTVWGEHGLGKLRQGWARVPLWSFSKPGGP